MQKIKEEQLKIIKEQEFNKNAIRNDLGFLETEKHKLLLAYDKIQKDQDQVKLEIEKEYGRISINLEDGSYEIIPESE